MTIDHTLTYDVVPIQDAFGPTQSDPDMDVRICADFFRSTFLLRTFFVLYHAIISEVVMSEALLVSFETQRLYIQYVHIFIYFSNFIPFRF